MSENKILDTMWDDNPIDITQEANFIWSIANKLRGSYMPDKYGDVVIPMTILRRFECALEATKQAVLKAYQSNPNYPSKALCKIAGFSFYNTSEYDLKELCNDSKHIAANFKNYISGFSANVKDIFAELEMDKYNSSTPPRFTINCVKPSATRRMKLRERTERELRTFTPILCRATFARFTIIRSSFIRNMPLCNRFNAVMLSRKSVSSKC